MNYAKTISDILSIFGDAHSVEDIQRIERGESKHQCPTQLSNPTDPICKQLFPTPFIFSYSALCNAIHDHTPLCPFINLEPPHPSDDAVVWDYAPGLEINFAALCNGNEQQIRSAVSFVDERPLIGESDFDGEPGIGPALGNSDHRIAWLLPQKEQDRILHLIQENRDDAGREIGWTIVRFVSSLLVAFARLGFVPHPYSWYEKHNEEANLDECLEACL